MSATDRAEAPEARAFLGPDFLGIGAPRCGTTMLDRLLRTHPALSLPRYTKEVHFFDERHALGLDWYEDQFEPDEGDGCLRGEVTPHYLADDGAFARIEALEARPRFLVMLRDPVDRMVSRYRHGRRRKSETASFREVASRTRPSAAGDYAASLERWFEVFSRERFLVLIYERATQDRDGLAAALGTHLGVDPAGFDTSVLEERVNAGVSGEYFGRAAVLRGARGQPGCDLNALASAIAGLSRFAASNADAIESVEMNPLRARPDGCVGLDALIVRKAS